MSYSTIGGLFTGICDAIREKDGTTGLINHQDIPDRISAISGSGEGGGIGVFKSPFYTYDGTSGMKIENMVASNFKGNSAIFLNEAFLPGDSTWEIGVKFTWPKTLSKSSNVLFGSWKSSYFKCPTLEIGSNNNPMKVWAAIPDGNSVWNHVGEYIATATPGEDYWIRFNFDGEKYIVSLSSDGQTFEDIIQIDYGVMYQDVNNSMLQFGGINRSSNHYFEGSIDLKETYIKIDGEIWRWGGGITIDPPLNTNERYYIYKSGEEMNEHSLTIHQYYNNSKKTAGWIFVDLWYMQTVTSDLITVDGHKRVGVTLLAEGEKSTNNARFSTFSMRDTPEVKLSGYDYKPIEEGTTYFEQDILRYQTTKTRMSGTFYFDIPDGLEEFYILISTVNIDLYIQEIWLE